MMVNASRYSKLWIVALMAVSLGVTAGCQSQEDEEYVPTPAITPAATPAMETSTLPAPPAGSVAPSTSLPATSLPAQQTVQPGATSLRPTVNPAHGQPFHDCSIAVGAPLPLAAQSTPALTPTQAMPQNLPQAVPSAPVLPKFQSGAKLNPPHGKPGHRCEIAVGAPLS